MTAQIIRFRDYQNQSDLPPMHGDMETSLAKLNHLAAEVFNVLMIDTAHGQNSEAAATEDTARRNIRGNVCNDGVYVAIISNDIIAFGNGDGDGVYAAIIRNDIITFGNGDDDTVIAGANSMSTLTNLAQFTSTLHNDVHGSAVITVDCSGDTITLVGVSASSLHAGDFVFV